MSQYNKQKTKNGINLIQFPIIGTKAVTVMALFPVGSRYEDANISGASHFVEHLMFKGTKKRPTAQHIARQLEAVGADYNAFTYKDYTGYYIKINSTEQELAFDMLSDMLQNSKFDPEEIEREKGVIVEELRMYEDNPTMAVDQLFDKTIFGNCPLGWDVGGNIETVRSISRDQLFNYYKTYYTANNMVLVVAGDVAKADKLDEYLQKFNHMPKGAEGLVNDYTEFKWPVASKLEEKIAVQKRDLDQAHIIMGFPGLANGDKDRYAAAVMSNILGSGMKSRLFVEVRERRGLAYMVRAGLGYHRDCGIVQIQAGLDPARLGDALKVIINELKKIASETVSDVELKEAKGNMMGRLSLSSEDSSNMADWYAKQFWFESEIKSPDQIFKKIKKITVNDVKSVAQRLFDMEKMHLAAIGNFKKSDVLKMLN